MSKILGAGFDSDTLTDVIRTLHDFYLANKEPSLASTLLEVSKNNQIPILSLLMSNEERKGEYPLRSPNLFYMHSSIYIYFLALSEIVNSLKGNTSEADTSTAAVQIMKRFNLV